MVISFPLVARSVRAGIEQVDRRYEDIAATLGAGSFRILRTITLPLASRGIAAGAVLGFSRALGEFGATIMVAGAIPGRTRTLAVGIYTLVETGREEAAWSLLLVSALLAFGAIYASNRLVEQGGPPVIDLSIDITMRQGAFVLSVRDAASVEVLGVFGPSGSGKTSLLEAIAGIRRPDAGEIRIGDRILFSSAKQHRSARARASHRLRAAGCAAVSESRREGQHQLRSRAHARSSATSTSLVAILDLAGAARSAGRNAVRRREAARRDRARADDAPVDPAARRAAGRRRSRAPRRDPSVHPANSARAARAADLRHARRSRTEFNRGSCLAPGPSKRSNSAASDAFCAFCGPGQIAVDQSSRRPDPSEALVVIDAHHLAAAHPQ